jgi:hypothetical protein
MRRIVVRPQQRDTGPRGNQVRAPASTLATELLVAALLAGQAFGETLMVITACTTTRPVES